MDISLKHRILHLFFPTRCPVCGEFISYDELFCAECSGKLARFTGDFTVKGADGFTAAFVYDENISPAVIQLKRGVCGNADRALGMPLAAKLRENGAAVDIIVPVPMHRSARRERGFNQAELIAAVIGKELSIPVAADCAVKLRKTAAQKELDRVHRMNNLRNAFRIVRPERVRGKSVLIVDDVCTTGSTLAELAAVMRKSGAISVYCAASCKTPLTKPNKAD